VRNGSGFSLRHSFSYIYIPLKKYFLIALLFPLILFSQQKKGKEWYLLDSIDPKSFSMQDKYLLDSLLPRYHNAGHDSVRVRCVMSLANSLGDENLWTRYNRLGLQMAEKGGDDDVFIIYRSYALSNIGYELANLRGNLTEALKMYEEAMKLQTRVNDQTGISASLNNIADIYKKQGNSDKAIEYHIKSLNAKEKNNDKLGVGISLLNLGSIYRSQGDIAAAVNCFSKALKIFEIKNEKQRQASTLNNLAHVYYDEGDTAKAIETFSKANLLFEIVGEKQSVARSLSNLGKIYLDKGNIKKALEYFYKAKQVSESINDKNGSASGLIHLSTVFRQEGRMDSAIYYIERSITELQNIENKNNLAEAYQLAANIYFQTKNVSRAEECAKRSLALAKELGYPAMIKGPALTLYAIYRNAGKKEAALEMYELHIKMRDSLERVENKKAILRQQFKSEYDKKAIADSIAAANVRLIEQNKHEHEIARQKLFTYGGIVGFILMLMVAFISFRAFKNKQQANKAITQQKHIIEEKQKEILDSINYAKRIQYTLLAHDEYLRSNLGEHFVLFKPKDIVSGDFYWATSVSGGQNAEGSRFYLAVCDSTGHGVPGAFMSLLNISFLNEAINEKRIFEPNEVLNYVRKRLIESISKEDQKDGFDGVLVCFDTSSGTISYAAANTSPLLFSDGELKELPYDKMPVGQGERLHSFTLHKVDHKKDDILYVGTDGYVDQFGGADGKKFKYRRLCDTLKQNAALDLNAQKNVLETTFNEWKGNLEQVDDVLVIGVKL
jgi:serine phosphatase RsbU (regulator of sigma subunit)/lipopolysaccharide biosynthesis regulator YciM